MKRFQFAGVAVAALAVLVTAAIAFNSSGDDDTRIETGAPTTEPTTTMVAPSTTIDSVTTTAPIPLVDLHAQRWNDVVAADPNLLGMTGRDGIVRYRYVGPNGNASPFGREPSIVATAEISYGDISGDGIDEAFIPVLGAQGAITVLVYYATSVAPRSAEAEEPYWLPGGLMFGGRAETFAVLDGQLARTASVYSQLDRPCCPGATVTTVYALVGGQLVVRTPTTLTGTTNGWTSATNFFTASIRDGRYDDVYPLFAPDLQSRISGEQWHLQFDEARAAFVEVVHGDHGPAGLVLTTVHQQGDALVVRRQEGAFRFGFNVMHQGWLIDELELHDTPYVAPDPREGFVQGAFDLVSVDETAKTALVLLTCTAPVDKTITTPSLMTVALADAYLQLNAADPPVTFSKWVAAARTQRHWHIGIATLLPPALPKIYVSTKPTSNLDICP